MSRVSAGRSADGTAGAFSLWRGSWIAAGLYCAAILPALVFDIETGKALAHDMRFEHLPLINHLIEHPLDVFWPGANVPSLPGQHLLLAWAARALGYGAIDARTLPIRLLHAGFGLAYVVATVPALRLMMRRGGFAERPAWIGALWLAAGPSYFVAQSTLYISTDVPGLLMYLGLLMLEIVPVRSLAARVAVSSLLVLERQAFAPALAMPFLVEPRRFVRRLLSAELLTLAIPGLILLAFIAAWGGLVPPLQRGLLPGGLFPQSVLHAVAYLGLVAPLFGAVLWPAIKAPLRRPLPVAAAVAAGAALWLIAPSTPDPMIGRWGSIVWTLAEHGPAWDGRSVLALPLAALGAVFAWTLADLSRRERDARVVTVAAALYLAFQILVIGAFQRYVEPAILLSLALVAARSVPSGRSRAALLAVSFAAYDLVGIAHLYRFVGS